MKWSIYYELGAWFGEAEDSEGTYATFSQTSAERVAVAIDAGDIFQTSESIKDTK
jgi:hypothetical protein